MKDSKLKDKQQKAYLKMHETSGIEVGDTVKVVGKAENYQSGWQKPWIKCTDREEGMEREQVVRENGRGNGFILDSCTGCYYPCFVLELVKKKEDGPTPEVTHVQGDDPYEIDYDKSGDFITVNGAKVTFREVREIRAHMHKLRK